MNDKASQAHIAIVDDALLHESLCDCLESAAYSTEGFASGEEFLASNSGANAACFVFGHSLLTLDILLPGVSCLELQRRLPEGADPAVVFVTAHATDANREIALKLGAKTFLYKPVRCQELLNAVRASTPS